MASSLFPNNPQNQIGNRNPMQMVQQFSKFVKDMKGKNPKQMVLDLISNGQMSNSQFNQFMEQAKQIEPLFRNILK